MHLRPIAQQAGDRAGVSGFDLFVPEFRRSVARCRAQGTDGRVRIPIPRVRVEVVEIVVAKGGFVGPYAVGFITHPTGNYGYLAPRHQRSSRCRCHP